MRLQLLETKVLKKITEYHENRYLKNLTQIFVVADCGTYRGISLPRGMRRVSRLITPVPGIPTGMCAVVDLRFKTESFLPHKS